MSDHDEAPAQAAEQEEDRFEVIAKADHIPYCPIEDIEGNLYVVNNNGDIYSYLAEEKKLQASFTTNGQPTSIVFDAEGNSFIADGAHQAILYQTYFQENRVETNPIIKDYEGMPLKGPHSLILSDKHNILFFTDAGPFGETSLEHPDGAIYAIDLTETQIKLVSSGLAFPTGLALNEAETCLYVSETCRNRILKVVFNENGTYHTSVFKQFSGRFGPTAIARDPESGNLYVARFEFEACTDKGIITVLSEDSEVIEEIKLPGLPELSGLYFSRQDQGILFATERST